MFVTRLVGEECSWSVLDEWAEPSEAILVALSDFETMPPSTTASCLS